MNGHQPSPWTFPLPRKWIWEAPLSANVVSQYEENGCTIKVCKPGYAFDYWPQRSVRIDEN